MSNLHLPAQSTAEKERKALSSAFRVQPLVLLLLSLGLTSRLFITAYFLPFSPCQCCSVSREKAEKNWKRGDVSSALSIVKLPFTGSFYFAVFSKWDSAEWQHFLFL